MRIFPAALLGLAALASPALAQDAASEPTIALELNGVEPFDTACRLTFMATNGLATDIDKFVVETVILTTEGKVARLTIFDLRALPTDRPRVRQFDVPELACDSVGQVLINGVDACDGEGHQPATCSKALDLSTLTDVELIG